MGPPVLVIFSSILCVFVLSAHQGLSKTMVDSDSHSESDGFAGKQGPSYKLVHGNTKEIMSM